ncbi:hypothetical protein [Hymenobacter jeollabukensis]|uniref:Uncharacterized protein n=1 Tax=Hymenobacter jeollabukensis TaxID=2025313 RepID=A0A5R8WHR3_9BACT|nr:hypothetical protein [Hymenobacter jeollabukensis]TLM87847.1 hypothetical protein FDY95_25465 [Hymenobacter jeollabukensis]
MKKLVCGLLSAGLLLPGCKSDSEKAADALQQVARAAAESPEAKAREAAWKLATTRPAKLAAGAPKNLRLAVEQLLPLEGYLQVVSVRAVSPAEPAILQLPTLWRPVKGNYPTVAPGYRQPFEAVLKWKPTGYAPGEKVPTALALEGPWAPDTLRGFALREPQGPLPGQATPATILVKAGQTVTVRGLLYAYATSPTAGDSPRLLLYPYRNPLGPPDTRHMVYLPL